MGESKGDFSPIFIIRCYRPSDPKAYYVTDKGVRAYPIKNAKEFAKSILQFSSEFEAGAFIRRHQEENRLEVEMAPSELQQYFESNNLHTIK